MAMRKKFLRVITGDPKQLLSCAGYCKKMLPVRDFTEVFLDGKTQAHYQCRRCRLLEQQKRNARRKETVVIPEFKTCAGPCEKRLPSSEFYRNSAFADGLMGWCRKCDNERSRKRSEVQSICGVKFKNSWTGRCAKVSPRVWQKLAQEQDWKCKCCRRSLRTGYGVEPHVDHCHTYGKVRFVLCERCNVVLGMIEESPKLARLFVKLCQEIEQMKAKWIVGGAVPISG